MAITVLVKTAVVDIGVDADATIATALNTGVTFTTIYGVSVLPISNTKAKVIVVYA